MNLCHMIKWFVPLPVNFVIFNVSMTRDFSKSKIISLTTKSLVSLPVTFMIFIEYHVFSFILIVLLKISPKSAKIYLIIKLFNGITCHFYLMNLSFYFMICLVHVITGDLPEISSNIFKYKVT